MKAILMSIRPRHDKNILNGIKTIEIRKKFPIDYVGWVYIYCTKDNFKGIKDNRELNYRGKVVARFWCYKVEEHKDFACMFPYSKLRYNKATCLDQEEIEDYGFIEGKGYVPLYAIHITKLEIFDRPKEISEFYKVGYNDEVNKVFEQPHTLREQMALVQAVAILNQIKRAPQSWCYIEI